MKWLCCFILLLLQSCRLLHATIEVQRIPPNQDVIEIGNDETIILKFRLLGTDLTPFLIQYTVNTLPGQFPRDTLITNPSNPPYSVALSQTCTADLATEDSRQCKELQILVRGKPDIQGTIFKPSLVDVDTTPFTPVNTDTFFFRIQYQDDTTTTTSTTPSTTTETPEVSTVTTPTTTTPTPSSYDQTEETTTPPDNVNMNTGLLELSKTDYVMFAALISLAIVVAISLFINIFLCFKLRSQRLELLQKDSSGTVEPV